MLKKRWGPSEYLQMDAEIAKANIEHFKKLLETVMDAAKRDVVKRLLAEEELKLAAALKKG